MKEQPNRHNEARTPNAKFLRLVERIKNIEYDPLVVAEKFVDLPPEYEGLTQDIANYLYPEGMDGKRRRFSMFDEAGFPPFIHGGTLHILTRKGIVKIPTSRH